MATVTRTWGRADRLGGSGELPQDRPEPRTSILMICAELQPAVDKSRYQSAFVLIASLALSSLAVKRLLRSELAVAKRAGCFSTNRLFSGKVARSEPGH